MITTDHIADDDGVIAAGQRGRPHCRRSADGVVQHGMS